MQSDKKATIWKTKNFFPVLKSDKIKKTQFWIQEKTIKKYKIQKHVLAYKAPFVAITKKVFKLTLLTLTDYFLKRTDRDLLNKYNASMDKVVGNDGLIEWMRGHLCS